MIEQLRPDPDFYKGQMELLVSQARQEHRPMTEVETYQYVASVFCLLGCQYGGEEFNSKRALEQAAYQLVVRAKTVLEERSLDFEFFRDHVVFARPQRGENHGTH